MKSNIKHFSTLQIELTTRCPLRCRMCVREGARDWQVGDMKFNDFKKLITYFKDVERVVLEGWGESLLHKNIIEIIRLVKAEGPEVGFVTSGMSLKKDIISELITAGVDFIGFSMSGSTPETHDSIRVNSDFQNLLSNIRALNEFKAVKKLKRPKLHIVYLMLKDNIFEIPELIKLAKNIGIRDIILVNIIQISNEQQEKLRVFSCDDENEYEESMKEAETKAQELNINLKRQSLSPTEVYVCEENPLQNLYISVDGNVSPCVYLYPPVSSPFKRIFCGVEHRIEKLSFGNIFEKPFSDIWNNKEYAAFRNRFILRKKRNKGVSSFLRNIERLRKSETSALPAPPTPCMTCHKILGV